MIATDHHAGARPSIGAGWLPVLSALMLVAVLAPEPGQPGFHPSFFAVLPLTASGWLDVLANLTLYVPFGFVLARRGAAAWHVWLAGAALSAATEMLQRFVPGRDPSITDILANTCGASLGSAIALAPIGAHVERGFFRIEVAMSHLLLAPRRVASLYSLAWAAFVAAIVVATAWLLAPSPPSGARYGTRYYVRSPMLDTTSSSVRIGGGGDDNSYFRGLIDEVRIFDRARPAETIRADMAQPVSSNAQPPSDLIAAYGFDRMDEDAARDQTGRGHDGRIKGATWTAQGRHGGALSFDGQSSEVVIPPAPDLTPGAGMTLEAWILPMGKPARWPPIVEHNSYFLYGSSPDGPYLAAGGGRLGQSNETVRSQEPLDEGQWSHLAFTYDGKTLSLYVNGILAASERWWSGHQPAEVSIDGQDLSFGTAVDRARLDRSLMAAPTLRAEVTCGELETARAPVFLLMAPGDTGVLGLIAEGDDLFLRARTRAARLGLLSPEYRLPGAFGGCQPGRPVDIRVAGPLQNPRAEIDGRNVDVAGLGLGSSWAFLIHSELLPARLRTACAIVWLALLMVPFGFWTHRALPTAAGSVLLAATFWYTPQIWTVPSIDAIELAAVCSGVLAGAICQPYARTLRT